VGLFFQRRTHIALITIISADSQRDMAAHSSTVVVSNVIQWRCSKPTLVCSVEHLEIDSFIINDELRSIPGSVNI
jgi:hypothetical protein